MLTNDPACKDLECKDEETAQDKAAQGNVAQADQDKADQDRVAREDQKVDLGEDQDRALARVAQAGQVEHPKDLDVRTSKSRFVLLLQRNSESPTSGYCVDGFVTSKKLGSEVLDNSDRSDSHGLQCIASFFEALARAQLCVDDNDRRV